MYWIEYESLHDGGLHRLVGYMGDRKGSLVDADYEYRLIFDPVKDMWRLDQRRHAEGG